MLVRMTKVDRPASHLPPSSKVVVPAGRRMGEKKDCWKAVVPEERTMTLPHWSEELEKATPKLVSEMVGTTESTGARFMSTSSPELALM